MLNASESKSDKASGGTIDSVPVMAAGGDSGSKSPGLRPLIIFLLIFALSVVGEYLYRGLSGVRSGVTLTVMEVGLSFDNAVLNAAVLMTLSPLWQRRFLTWGIIFAVFIMRLVFPVFIVSTAAGVSLAGTFDMAVRDPLVYAEHLDKSKPVILAFGGAFLFMIFMAWLFDKGRELHWISSIEARASTVASIGEFKIIASLFVVLSIGYAMRSVSGSWDILFAMVLGVAVHEGVDFLKNLTEHSRATTLTDAGIGAFIYLEILDASCSFDGTVGAFAITSDIFIIMVGLSVGAIAVRSLTIYLVETKKMAELAFLEHGANWGIGFLGLFMLLELIFHIPEFITGFAGVAFILASLYSSVRKNRGVFTDDQGVKS